MFKLAVEMPSFHIRHLNPIMDSVTTSPERQQSWLNYMGLNFWSLTKTGHATLGENQQMGALSSHLSCLSASRIIFQKSDFATFQILILLCSIFICHESFKILPLSDQKKKKKNLPSKGNSMGRSPWLLDFRLAQL